MFRNYYLRNTAVFADQKKTAHIAVSRMVFGSPTQAKQRTGLYNLKSINEQLY